MLVEFFVATFAITANGQRWDYSKLSAIVLNSGTDITRNRECVSLTSSQNVVKLNYNNGGAPTSYLDYGNFKKLKVI
jgi:hypothetical protein